MFRPIDGAPSDPADALEQFWQTLRISCSDGPLLGTVEVQDELFRFYVPMARARAQQYSLDHRIDLSRTERAAELGLAQAVLAWQNPDRLQFERSARGVITARLAALTRRAKPIYSIDATRALR